VIAIKSKFYNIFYKIVIISIFKWYNIKMATRRGQVSTYDIGEAPPFVNWTFVKGDTASFKVYLTDDAKVPLTIPDWNISMQIKRPTTNPVISGQITDTATLLYTLTPTADEDDLIGEFTVSLTAAQTATLQTNDIFDIEVSLTADLIVWTVAQGKLIVLEDVTA
jgi:hypothetical protein